MGIKDSLRNSLKKGLVGLLVGASAIGSFSGLVGCDGKYGRERQDYSRESQEELNEDLLVITYDEWKNEDRLKEHAQYILKHPDEAYERLDEGERKMYDEMIEGMIEELKNKIKREGFSEAEKWWKDQFKNEGLGVKAFFERMDKFYGLTKFRNPKLSTVLDSSLGEKVIGAIELEYTFSDIRKELSRDYPIPPEYKGDL